MRIEIIEDKTGSKVSRLWGWRGVPVYMGREKETRKERDRYLVVASLGSL